jgi:ornithine--oxo-acid transaminase
VGIELSEPARPYCLRLLERGVLCKETHDRVIRLAPPLVTEEADLDWMVEQVRAVFA